MNARIERWVEVARWAPSGDNSQPWRVQVSSEADGAVRVRLSLREEIRKAPVFFDKDCVASFLSLGCFARNLEWSAAADGYGLVRIVREGSALQSSFILHLAPAVPGEFETGEAILARCVSRTGFDRRALANGDRQALESCIAAFHAGTRLTWIDGRRKSLFSGIIARVDGIRFAHRRLRDEFLAELRFGAEAWSRMDGLDVETLGIDPMAKLLLRSLRAFRFLRAPVFGALRPVFVILGMRLPIYRSAGLAALQLKDDSPAGWFELGRSVQSFWVLANRKGLGVQPVGDTLLVYRSLLEASSDSYSSAQQALLRWAGKALAEEVGLDCSSPLLVFRVGYGAPPRARSRRKPVEMNSFSAIHNHENTN